MILFSIGSHTHINYSVLSSDIAARLKITGGYDQSLLALGGVKKLCNFESLIPDSLINDPTSSSDNKKMRRYVFFFG